MCVTHETGNVEGQRNQLQHKIQYIYFEVQIVYKKEYANNSYIGQESSYKDLYQVVSSLEPHNTLTSITLERFPTQEKKCPQEATSTKDLQRDPIETFASFTFLLPPPKISDITKLSGKKICGQSPRNNKYRRITSKSNVHEEIANKNERKKNNMKLPKNYEAMKYTHHLSAAEATFCIIIASAAHIAP